MNPFSEEKKEKCVLVADDSATIRTIVAWVFKGAGYQVVEARDGEEALSFARSWKPDLIVLDVHMPEKDGIEALTELRQDEAFASTPVIMLTGDEARDVVLRTASLKIEECIVKDDLENITQKLKAHLET